jgi:hypothetical protein
VGILLGVGLEERGLSSAHEAEEPMSPYSQSPHPVQEDRSGMLGRSGSILLRRQAWEGREESGRG